MPRPGQEIDGELRTSNNKGMWELRGIIALKSEAHWWGHTPFFNPSTLEAERSGSLLSSRLHRETLKSLVNKIE